MNLKKAFLELPQINGFPLSSPLLSSPSPASRSGTSLDRSTSPCPSRAWPVHVCIPFYLHSPVLTPGHSLPKQSKSISSLFSKRAAQPFRVHSILPREASAHAAKREWGQIRKKGSTALRKSEEKKRATTRTTKEGIFEKTATGKVEIRRGNTCSCAEGLVFERKESKGYHHLVGNAGFKLSLSPPSPVPERFRP